MDAGTGVKAWKLDGKVGPEPQEIAWRDVLCPVVHSPLPTGTGNVVVVKV